MCQLMARLKGPTLYLSQRKEFIYLEKMGWQYDMREQMIVIGEEKEGSRGRYESGVCIGRMSRKGIS